METQMDNRMNSKMEIRLMYGIIWLFPGIRDPNMDPNTL